jgi:hypothetical protein
MQKHLSPGVGVMAAFGGLATVVFVLAGTPPVMTQQQPFQASHPISAT